MTALEYKKKIYLLFLRDFIEETKVEKKQKAVE